MRRFRRVVRWSIYGSMVVLAVLAGAYYVVAHTEPGVQRAAGYLLDRVRNGLHGNLRVESVRSDGLLSGVTLEGVRIDDPDGRLFARADSIRIGYSVFQFIRGRIVFDEVALFGGDAVVERLPGQRWNYEVVLGLGGDDGNGGDRRWIALDNVELNGTDVTVRTPWDPAEEPDADTARLLLEPVPGGMARVYRFAGVSAELPSIVLQSPSREGVQILVRHLATDAYIYTDPLRVHDLDGSVEVQDSIVSFGARRLELPDSRTAARGRVVLGRETRYDIHLVGADLAFADLRWLLPVLPETGRGDLDFLIRTRTSGDVLLQARNARVRTGATDLEGSFGLITGTPWRLVDVDMEASPLELSLVERIAGRELPVRGLLTGTFSGDGPLADLRSEGDVRLTRDGVIRADVRWSGMAGLGDGFRAGGLEAEIRRLELGLVANHVPALALRGAVRGNVTLDGDLDTGLAVQGTVRHVADGPESVVAVDGTMRLEDSVPRVDVRIDADPVVMRTVAVQYPAVGRLAGQVRGTARLRGRLDDLEVDADLETPAGGVDFRGRLDRTGAVSGAPARYVARGSLDGFRIHEVVRDVPTTRISTTFTLDAAGLTAAELDGSLDMDVTAARVREFDVSAGNVRLRFGDGRARVDTLTVLTDAGRVEARGTFGLTRDAPGTAEVTVRADSLNALESFFFPDTALVVDPDAAAVPIAGGVTVRTTLEGSLQAFAVRGAADLRQVRYGEIAVDSGRIHFEATGLLTDTAAVRAEADVRTLRFFGRTLERARVDGRYAGSGAGDLRVLARAPGGDSARAVSSFRRLEAHTAFALDTLELHTAGRTWRLGEPTAGRFGTDGLRLDDLELVRASGAGRIRLSGTLPWRERFVAGDSARQASFVVEADAFRAGDFLRLAQMDTAVDGLFVGRVRVTGAARSPSIQGRLRADSLRIGAARLDSAETTVSYADRLLSARMEGWRGGSRVTEGEAEVPVDLALGAVPERRLDRPLTVRLRSMDLPASVALSLVDGFRNVDGRVNGLLELSGTTRSPVLGGQLRLEQGAATFDPLGVRYRTIQLRLDVTDSRVVTVSGRLETELGGADVDGTVTFEELNDPTFGLSVTARRFQASGRRDFRSLASGDVRLTGTYTRPTVTGTLQLTTGELNIDELWRQSQIVQLESPFLFEVIDTSLVSVRQVLPRTTSPFLQNIRVDSLALDIGSDIWLRSRQLNVAVRGQLTVNFDRQTQDIAMTGVLQAVRGTYVLQPGAERFAATTEPFQRRFDIQGGTIEFAGTPGINPGLNVTAGYRVNLRRQGDALNILATVTGTLQNPRVQLTSDAQPPISETDLVSYLYFGQPSFQLGRSEAELLSGLVLNTTSALLQNVFSSAGIFDYFGISAPSLGDRTTVLEETSNQALYAGTLVEAGRYLGRDFFLAGSFRVPDLKGGFQPAKQLGLRLEWQFHSTWTAETFWESRFLRQPTFGLAALSDERPVVGLSLFREWSY